MAVAQVGLEGEISEQTVQNEKAKTRKAHGDLIPWTLCQYYLDYSFPKLAGARVIRLAVHTDVQDMGYGTRVLELLKEYYEGKMPCLEEKPEEEYVMHNIKV